MPARRAAPACSLLIAFAFACAPERSSQDAGFTDAGQDAGAYDGGPRVRRIVALELSPSLLELQVGEVSGLTANATFDDGQRAEVTGTVTWQSAPAGLVSVETLPGIENLARVEALAEGQAQVTAHTGAVVSAPAEVRVTQRAGPDGGAAPKEVRAVWVTRFSYGSASAVQRIIERAASAGFNVVYFQIRGAGDAYYRSSLVPWARALSGTLGQDPGWDPLQVAIDAARARGLELHAYFNAFSAWPTPSACASAGGCACRPAQGRADSCALPPASPTGQPEHVLRAHPEWMAVDATGRSVDPEYYYLSPGNPEVRAHLKAVADELLARYDVDGLHLDRIRYPGATYSHDPASLAAYQALPAATRPAFADWQRAQVSATVSDLYDVVRARRPDAVLSAAVWGIYKPLPGCTNQSGYETYFQDSIGWTKAGIIDALVPMTYWDLGSGCTDWGRLTDGFLAGVSGRHLVAGMYALDQGVPKLERMGARIEYARTVGAAGTAIFASAFLDAKTTGSPTWPEVWPQFRADGGPYEQDAGVPEVTWR